MQKAQVNFFGDGCVRRRRRLRSCFKAVELSSASGIAVLQKDECSDQEKTKPLISELATVKKTHLKCAFPMVTLGDRLYIT